MRNFIRAAAILNLMVLTACQTSDALNSVAVNHQPMEQSQVAVNAPVPVPLQTPDRSVEQIFAVATHGSAPISAEMALLPPTLPDQNTQVSEIQMASLSPNPEFLSIAEPRTSKTYLINGLLSAVPFIGYGFRNLHKKMPNAQIHSYISPIESNAVIMPTVLREIEQAYKADPNVAINLIGISLGADFVTVLAEKLNKKNIPVNYLGIVDGTNLRPITPNVVKADNLTCTFLDCLKAKARLAKGNDRTVLVSKKFKSSHIPLGDNDELHARVIAQSDS